MNILHDKSSVKSSSAKWIDRGYAREDVHSLRLQYVYTPEQREANRQICDAGPDEAHRSIKQAAESKNAVMASVMAAIAREFICYQYESEDPAPYGSSRWELFFWCNDFSNTLHGYPVKGIRLYGRQPGDCHAHMGKWLCGALGLSDGQSGRGTGERLRVHRYQWRRRFPGLADPPRIGYPYRSNAAQWLL